MLAPPRQPRYETLDAWRGAACLSVVVFHSAYGYVVTPESKAETLTHGGTAWDWLATACSYLWVGVPLFFVISGYCISASVDAARRKPRPVGRFFTRRFRRIYPPLWAFLALAAVGVWLLPEIAMPGPHTGFDRPLPYPHELSWQNWAGAVTLTEEWRSHFGGPPRAYMTGQLWTLCYEEQFYLIAGLLLWLVPRWFFAGVAVVSAGVLANIANWPMVAGFDLNRLRLPWNGFFFDGLWLAFAAGVAVYYRTNYATAAGRRSLDLLLVGGVFSALGGVPSWVEFSQGVPAYLVSAFAFALLLGWLQPFDAATAAPRVLIPLRYCGRMCYSLYLIHGPIVVVLKWNLYRAGVTSPAGTVLVTVPLCLVAALVPSAAFHHLIERRFARHAESVRRGRPDS